MPSVLCEVPSERNQGHTLLLLESETKIRTFKDYPDMVTCLESMDEMYSDYRNSIDQDKENYVFTELCSWFDEFHSIEMMVFDKELGRYKQFHRNDLKEIFKKELEKQVSLAENANCNGVSSSQENVGQPSGDDNDENWEM